MVNDSAARAAHGNRYLTPPVIAVSSGGTGIAWSAGQFNAPPDVLDRITTAVTLANPVLFNGVELVPDDTTPLGALAAMVSLRPGRTRITRAPADVIDYLTTHGYPHPFLDEAH